MLRGAANMFNSIGAAQVSDTTGGDSSNAVGNIIIQLYYKELFQQKSS